MPRLRLTGIGEEGAPAEDVGALPSVAEEASAATANFYRKAGFSPPWIGYLAIWDDSIVGTCAFKGAPAYGRVEIAYYTFPPFEGRGVARMMAAELIAVAHKAEPEIEIFAQTLPETNASNVILQKLGFEYAGRVNHPREGVVWEWRLSR